MVDGGSPNVLHKENCEIEWLHPCCLSQSTTWAVVVVSSVRQYCEWFNSHQPPPPSYLRSWAKFLNTIVKSLLQSSSTTLDHHVGRRSKRRSQRKHFQITISLITLFLRLLQLIEGVVILTGTCSGMRSVKNKSIGGQNKKIPPIFFFMTLSPVQWFLIVFLLFSLIHRGMVLLYMLLGEWPMMISMFF